MHGCVRWANPVMKPLIDLYTRWGVLTRAESEAIHARDWAALSEYQSEKQSLRDEITRLQEVAASKPRQAGADAMAANKLKPVLEQLIRMESDNASLLAAQKQLLAEQQSALRHASRTLHQVHQAYAAGRSEVWNSYS